MKRRTEKNLCTTYKSIEKQLSNNNLARHRPFYFVSFSKSIFCRSESWLFLSRQTIICRFASYSNQINDRKVKISSIIFPFSYIQFIQLFPQVTLATTEAHMGLLSWIQHKVANEWGRGKKRHNK